MAKPVYIANNFGELDNLQRKIMFHIDDYCHFKSHRNKPITHKRLLEDMTKKGISKSTTVNAINSLEKKGYIRRAVDISSKKNNRTSYIQLRRI